jgi:hypothetical protein
MNYYNKFGGKYVSCDLSSYEITSHINAGGFEPLERTDIESMTIGGYLPESPDANPCFNYAINGEDTGFEWHWGDMPKSFHAKLWHKAMPRRAAGTPPDTSLHLGDARRAWLKDNGGIQPTIQAMIDQAMTGGV